MAKQTLQQQYAQQFRDAGFVEVLSKSSKYKVFFKRFGYGTTGHDRYFFLGKSGAVRVSEKNAVTFSVSITGTDAIAKYINLGK